MNLLRANMGISRGVALWAIINATPDSFFGGSRAVSEGQIVAAALRAIEQGATRLDIGGFSTRPGFTLVTEAEELRRLRGAISVIKREVGDFPLSVDTFRSSVVEALYDEFGDFVVNDIEGGARDGAMYATVGRLALTYVMMSQDATIESMLSFFDSSISRARECGVGSIILDPGFGFGKSVEQNYECLARLGELGCFSLPILAGLSRKSMIWRTLGITADEALNGTSVLNFAALERGATILRVHDTLEAAQCVKLFNSMA